ncbi:hypothetical protein Pryu01_02890 [Paraliobacillus ryukyuensis]|uniref:Uncharacterized protein DUF4363 n=1 Tax=Paraliobacillus ryukyuensis TaxID=200904 RepID=A0A366DZ64_9BACI|nr:uncharacterized protein DUF4363 [Paraliobacillus ryukyuensis]
MIITDLINKLEVNTVKKFFLYFIPLCTLALFIFVMNSGSLLKQPLSKEDQLYESIYQIETNVKEKAWKKANKNINYAEAAWKKIVRRIQFSVEKEYIIDLNGTLSRIKGGIAARDDKAIMEEVYYFYELWHNLAK